MIAKITTHNTIMMHILVLASWWCFFASWKFLIPFSTNVLASFTWASIDWICSPCSLMIALIYLIISVNSRICRCNN